MEPNDSHVKSWKEGGVLVVCNMLGRDEDNFIYLLNTNSEVTYYRGFRLNPNQAFYSTRRSDIIQLLSVNSGTKIFPVFSDKEMLDKAPIKIDEKKSRLIVLKPTKE